MKIARLLPALLVLATASTCPDESGLPLPGPETKEVRIYFDADSVRVGDVVLAKVVGIFSRGVRLNTDGFPQSYSFASMDTVVALVEPAPKGPAVAFAFFVRGRQLGWARVTAMVNGVFGVDSVRVVPR